MSSYHEILKRSLPDITHHQNRYAEQLDRCVRPGCSWLDLGAGARVHGGWLGRPQEVLAEEPRCLIGCDLAAEQLRSNPYIDGAAIADAAHLPFRAASFDLVTANMVVEHLTEPLSVMREVRRVLTEGGRFVFVTPNRRHPAVWIMAALVPPAARRRLASWSEGRQKEDIFVTHYRANTVRRIEALARHADLRVHTAEVFFSYPMVRYPAWATKAEALWIRSARRVGLGGLGSNLLVELGPNCKGG